MNIFLRIFVFILIIWSLVAQLYVLAVPLSLWYMIYYCSYELIIAAILVDGYYQAFYSIPKLTFIFLFSVLFINFIKPKLLLYTEKNEIIS